MHFRSPDNFADTQAFDHGHKLGCVQVHKVDQGDKQDQKSNALK